jgi:thiosulfate/3-mercaptopyruvate sulfurtransferase
VKLLISSEELAADSAAIIFDCRFSLEDSEAGRREYDAGHIPRARYADLERDLSNMDGKGGRHPLPEKDKLVERLRAWGVNRESKIVCYDQNSGAVAGRLWWLVRWLGHADVCVLDGGLDAWIAAGFATDTEAVAPTRGNFAPGPALTRTCAADDLGDSNVTLIDARDQARFNGEFEPIDPVAGHIPGALCAPFSENLSAGRFLAPEALEARFRKLGVEPKAAAVCYCGSGVTATHNILALLLAGYPEPALYAGSWSDWISDPKRPIETA